MANDYTSEDMAPNMDALFQQGLSDQQAVEAEKKLTPPTDTYTSTPPLAVTVRKYEAKDGKPERVMFRAYGAFTGRHTAKEIRHSFQFSPDLMEVTDDRTGELKYDRASQNYILLRRAYQKVFGQFPATPGDIKNYMEQYPLGIRGVQYDGSNGPAFGTFNIFAVTA